MAKYVYTETLPVEATFSTLLTKLRRDAASEGKRELYIDARNDPTHPDTLVIRLVCEGDAGPTKGGTHG